MLINTTQLNHKLLYGISDVRYDIYMRLRYYVSGLIDWFYGFIYTKILRRQLVYIADDLWADLMDAFGRTHKDPISLLNNQIRREWSKHYVTTNTTSPR